MGEVQRRGKVIAGASALAFAGIGAAHLSLGSAVAAAIPIGTAWVAEALGLALVVGLRRRSDARTVIVALAIVVAIAATIAVVLSALSPNPGEITVAVFGSLTPAAMIWVIAQLAAAMTPVEPQTRPRNRNRMPRH